jgi:ATP-dependent DNA ligase
MFERLEIEPGACDGRCPDPTKVESSLIVMAEEKLDGHRALLHMHCQFERPYLTSRRISKKTGKYAENGLNVPQIMTAAAETMRVRQLNFTILDGELIVPGHPFEAVQSVTGALPNQAIAWQREFGFAAFRAFDILFVNGRDVRGMSLYSRKKMLHEVVEDLDSPFIKFNPFKLTSNKDEIQNWYDEILKDGGEGLILKDPSAHYGKAWTKKKKAATYDVVVMGFKDGKPRGKFRNMVGAVNFGIYKNGKLTKVGKCSGMVDGNVEWVTDHGAPGQPNRSGSWIEPYSSVQPEGSRAWFTMNKDKLLGIVVEVSGNGLTEKGAIRHPQFVRLRSDKSAETCTQLKE